MSTAAAPSLATEIQDWQSVWGEGFSQILTQAGGGQPFGVTTFTEKDVAAADLQATRERGRWLCFTADAGLVSEMACWVSDADGLALAQIAVGEPVNTNALFAPAHHEALLSLFHTVAGATEKLWAREQHSPCKLAWAGSQRPVWTPIAQGGLRIKSTSGAECLVHYWYQAAPAEPAVQPGQTPSVQVARSASTPAAAPVAADGNLGLLMDVELEATLRFGQKQMILKDVLELAPGAVIELDRQVRDPVELLVGGRVVARGNVVVVDGNYGLQIIELASSRARSEFLKK